MKRLLVHHEVHIPIYSTLQVSRGVAIDIPIVVQPQHHDSTKAVSRQPHRLIMAVPLGLFDSIPQPSRGQLTNIFSKSIVKASVEIAVSGDALDIVLEERKL